jgi:hypothetical protein
MTLTSTARYTHGYGVGKSPIWWSGYTFVELDLRLNRPSTMRCVLRRTGMSPTVRAWITPDRRATKAASKSI